MKLEAQLQQKMPGGASATAIYQLSGKTAGFNEIQMKRSDQDRRDRERA